MVFINMMEKLYDINGDLEIVPQLRTPGRAGRAALAGDRGLDVAVEDGFPAETIADLRSRGHAVSVQRRAGLEWHGFGAGQIAMRLGDGYLAASDFRNDGQAVGF